jgi:D-arabinonate dehydratase
MDKMKIIDINIRAYSAPYTRPISNGKYTYANTEIVVCEVLTNTEIRGIGWTHGSEIVLASMKSLSKRIIGQDPFNVERVWEMMYLPKMYGRKSMATRAISALDIALWDIRGKVAGRSVHQLLGGYRDAIPVYVAGGYYEPGKSLEGLREEVRQKVLIGAKAIKIKIGAASIAEDLERIDCVLDTVGPKVKVLVDANNAYDRIMALKMGRELDRRNIYWFEEPLSPDDIEGCSELTRRLDTPIAIGENEYTRWGFKQLIDAHAAQILNADAQVLGGITEWKKVVDLAMAAHILVAPHGDQEIHSHLVAAIPNGLILEYYDNSTNALLSSMFDSPLALDEAGNVHPSKRPGLGVTIQWDALERFQTYPINEQFLSAL